MTLQVEILETVSTKTDEFIIADISRTDVLRPPDRYILYNILDTPYKIFIESNISSKAVYKTEPTSSKCTVCAEYPVSMYNGIITDERIADVPLCENCWRRVKTSYREIQRDHSATITKYFA